MWVCLILLQMQVDAETVVEDETARADECVTLAQYVVCEGSSLGGRVAMGRIQLLLLLINDDQQAMLCVALRYDVLHCVAGFLLLINDDQQATQYVAVFCSILQGGVGCCSVL